ncbi:MAG: type IV secretion system protein [Proteobacteria bacterium]|nr:type IV secretion system protein [Pseudomonadota bacterium]
MKILSVFLAIVFLYLSCSEAAAAPTPGNANPQTDATYCYSLIYNTGTKTFTNKIVQPIVDCFTDSIQGIVPNMTLVFIQNLRNTYFPVVCLMFLLAVSYFGLKLMVGDVQRVKGDTVTLAIKVAVVTFYMDNAGFIYTSLLDIMHQLSSMVTAAAVSTHITGFCVAPNPLPLSGAVANRSAWQDPIWALWDCMLGYVLGLSEGSLALFGMLSFLLMMLFTLSTGVLIFIFGITFIFFLVCSVFRFLHVYIMSVLGLSFMFCIGYLFMPLILFKNTIEYFRNWFTRIMGFIITPVLMFAFMGIMLVALDIAVFTSQFSVWCTIGGASWCGAAGTAAAGPLAGPTRPAPCWHTPAVFPATSNPDEPWVNPTTKGQQLFCYLVGNENAKNSTINGNQYVLDEVKSIFSVANNGPASLGNTGGGGTVYNAAGPQGFACPRTFGGMFGFNTCDMSGMQSGSQYMAQSNPAVSPTGFKYMTLDLTKIANDLGGGAVCNKTYMGGAPALPGQNPVQYYYNCPYAENILVSLCVAAILVYIMFALVSFIPTLASSIGGDSLTANAMGQARGVIQNKVFGESAGGQSLESAKQMATNNARMTNMGSGSTSAAARSGDSKLSGDR